MHSAGMKFLPKFVGKKLRHRNLTGKKKKQVEAKKKAVSFFFDFFRMYVRNLKAYGWDK